MTNFSWKDMKSTERSRQKYGFDSDSDNNSFRNYVKDCFKSNESSCISNEKYILKFPITDKCYQSNNLGTQSDAKSSSRIKVDWTYALPSINDKYYEEEDD